jgi:alkanesulfonate monooxygenase SsuD/methylene tetrahydromethanopterin reductase-like flavin-dependent oxidoreductase (luciferase family)
MPIEFGIFDHIEAREGTPIDELYEERIDMVKRAEASGFYAFHLAEHHGHTLSTSPSQPVFLAALARETTTIKLIPTVVCLPLHNPVRIFEELAMLDVLSRGRLELGIGKGITPFEHLQFGHHPDEGPARSEEILTMLLEAWQTGIISSEGSEYYDFVELELPFEPIQKPYPPLWSAGNVEMAGRGGYNFLFPIPITDDVRGHYEELRTESRKQPNHRNPHVREPWIAQSQTVVIADTDEEAEAIGRRAWAYYMGTVARSHGLVPPHRQGSEIPEPDNPLATMFMAMDPIENELVVTGTVDRIRDYYLDQAKRGLANYFIVGTPAGDMTADEVRRTLDAFAAEVIPAVRELEASAVGAST